MRILLIASAYNSMTQRVHAELADRGHEVSVELALGDEVMRDGVRRYDPDLIIAPMLTRAIPEDIWSARPCFIVHPGPMGDRGPSSLDWAIMGGAARWGVTVLQANAEMDAGDIWASTQFAMPGELEELYVPDRGRGRRGRGGAAGGDQVRQRPATGPSRWITAERMSPGSCVRRAARPTDDRLAGRAHRDGAGQTARGRLQPRRAGRDRRHGVLPVRRASRRRAARPARDDPGPPGRRDLPRHRGRRGLDPAAAPPPGARRPGYLQAAGHPGARCRSWTAYRRSPRR